LLDTGVGDGVHANDSGVKVGLMRLGGGVASGTGEMTREARSSVGAADGMTRGARDGSGLGTGLGALVAADLLGAVNSEVWVHVASAVIAAYLAVSPG